MDERSKRIAAETAGFMPEAEGLALHAAGLAAGGRHPWVEIGSYCGKSTVYLGTAARAVGTVVFSIDHHRGSEEHQVGEEYHDPKLVDPETGLVDTLPEFRRTLRRAALEDVAIAVVGESVVVAETWATPLALVFVDGGHGRSAVHGDYEGWAPNVVPNGLLVIHDVFEDPVEGGRPPFEIYERAIGSGAFAEIAREGSLRVLRRVGEGI